MLQDIQDIIVLLYTLRNKQLCINKLVNIFDSTTSSLAPVMVFT